ncbi:FAD-binding protein [Nakamurella sp. YIM 132087]|uniref:D-lactate dehydrogenase (cytochrome) n=1 Tax=Nakamurella alba TaxID=2665158 RepID=A0A7K1FN80_9ACTN|nr:FAD-binding and (Fe-S)-binding domain-containing protein [Nakamurella alba]MTD15615.1 FAD-binding protein [Nakamurella alba]
MSTATLPSPSPRLLASLHAAGGTVRDRPLDRLAMAHDASHFLLVPQAVATPADPAEVGRLFAASAAAGVPLTFRSGGTSLSGQAVTDGVLVDTRRNFRGIEVLDGGRRVRVQPGATIRQVNTRLARLGFKLGPDPASENSCTLGGVLANNSSGMACGTVDNAYRTLESMVVVLPSGTVVDTAAADADDRLRALEPDLWQGLSLLRNRIRGNPASVRRITEQFAMKNTMGYGLNSFLDHSSPADILAHLMIGSEGTLGFVASAVLRTVPIRPHTASGLLYFDDLAAATAALPALVSTSPATIELLDATSLRVGKRDPDAPEVLKAMQVDRHAALLVEYQGLVPEELAELTASAAPVLGDLPLSLPADLTADPVIRGQLWHVRKGLYATVSGARPSGSTALLEDIVVPVPALLPTCTELIGLFDKHAYTDSVIFGHAKDGNIHFMITEKLGDTTSEDRLTAFTEDMVEVVLGHGGSLKAEHGTGRMMASYVRRQYGDELYEVMREVKRLFDPRGLLSPGVIITDDPGAHVRHLKTTPTVESEVDRCVECGFCEPVCPSRDLTTTPRQRIVLRRERERAAAAGDLELVAAIDEQYRYDGVQTCAVDGMCQTACPVLINTGDLVKHLRRDTAAEPLQIGWKQAAKGWKAGSALAATALDVAHKVPALAELATSVGRRFVDPDVLPQYGRDLPAGGRARWQPSSASHPDAKAVFVSACVGRMFGPAENGAGATGDGVGTAMARLAVRAGVILTVPPEIGSLCCGTPWKSKGLADGYAEMTDRVLPALWAATRQGELPVVCDASSCTEGFHQMLESAQEAGDPRAARIRTVDAVQFVRDEILPRLTVHRRKADLALHPTCSSTRMGLDPALREVAAAVADRVDVPAAWGCCAFAGDRGLLHPELTASATAPEAAEIAAGSHDAHASCNRTCELGMTRATGHPYRHVLELLDWATA